jgi:hypothetical protein
VRRLKPSNTVRFSARSWREAWARAAALKRRPEVSAINIMVVGPRVPWVDDLARHLIVKATINPGFMWLEQLPEKWRRVKSE